MRYLLPLAMILLQCSAATAQTKSIDCPSSSRGIIAAGSIARLDGTGVRVALTNISGKTIVRLEASVTVNDHVGGHYAGGDLGRWTPWAAGEARIFSATPAMPYGNPTSTLVCIRTVEYAS